ncbi:hypothetical protein [Streptomyces sp. NPDC002537]
MLGLVLLASLGAQARADQPAVPSCKLGVYLPALYDIDPSHNSFSARLNVWSLCPRADLDPIPNMLFSNGYQPKQGNSVRTSSGGVFRHLTVIEGRFRQGWDLHDYPFDRNTLEVLFTSSRDASKFVFEPDARNSAYDHHVHVPGWRVTGMHLEALEHKFVTNFGDPELPPGSGISYSRLKVLVSVQRSGAYMLFWQLVSPVLIVFLVTSLTFTLSDVSASFFQSRIGVLGASLFTILLSMNKVDSSLPPDSGITLIDQLHLLALGYVLIAVAAAMLSWHLVIKGHSETAVRRLSRAAFMVGMVCCAGAGMALTLLAATEY